MNTRISYRMLLVILGIVLLSSCKKEIAPASVPLSAKGSGKAIDGPIPSYPFDWSSNSTTYMPTNPANIIGMPWNAGYTNPIDINLASDYLPADGWQMVWSTFSPTTPTSGVPLYFVLYNVYRGLLRFYLYAPQNSLATSSVTHGLNMYNQSLTSSMLNFNGRVIIDNSSNQTMFSYANYRQLAVLTGTWYVFQYEIAYDPNIANTSYIDPSVPVSSTQALEWKSNWINVTQATFNGTITGTITGTIGQPQTFLSSLFNLSGQAATLGLEAFGLNNVPSGSLGAAYQSAIGNALGNTLSGFFNGVIGDLSNNSTAVNLTLSANELTTGSLVNNGVLEDVNLILPGQQNAQTGNGLTPVYNNVMGVFNVTGIPQVDISEQQWTEQLTDPYDGTLHTNYGVTATVNLTPGSVNAIFNPAIINSDPVNGCHIANLNTQLLVDAFADPNTQNYTYDATNLYLVYSNSSSSNPAVFSYYTQEDVPGQGDEGQPTPQLYVRITFDVVTNNGNVKKATIMKTFLSNQL